jgi:hypothetical protein
MSLPTHSGFSDEDYTMNSIANWLTTPLSMSQVISESCPMSRHYRDNGLVLLDIGMSSPMRSRFSDEGRR